MGWYKVKCNQSIRVHERIIGGLSEIHNNIYGSKKFWERQRAYKCFKFEMSYLIQTSESCTIKIQ